MVLLIVHLQILLDYQSGRVLVIFLTQKVMREFEPVFFAYPFVNLSLRTEILEVVNPHFAHHGESGILVVVVPLRVLATLVLHELGSDVDKTPEVVEEQFEKSKLAAFLLASPHK